MKAVKIMFVAAMLAASSCEKAKVNVDFNLDVADVVFVIDTTSATGTVSFSSTQFVSHLQAKLQEHDAGSEDVQSVHITNGIFTMLNPGAQNFDNVEKAYGYLSAGNLPETRILYNESIPDGITEVSMNADGANLKEYLKYSVVSFRADGFLSGANAERDTIRATLTFRVHGEIKP